MHTQEYNEMKKLFRKYLHPCTGGKVLDVGSLDVNGSYRTEIKTAGYTYEGCDIREGENVNHTVTLNGTESAFDWAEDGQYSHIISGSCLEHCKNPFTVVKESARVLKPGGYMIINAPFIWARHSHPYDCFRFLPEGFNALFEYAGLKRVETYMLKYCHVKTTFGVAQKEVC